MILVDDNWLRENPDRNNPSSEFNNTARYFPARPNNGYKVTECPDCQFIRLLTRVSNSLPYVVEGFVKCPL